MALCSPSGLTTPMKRRSFIRLTSLTGLVTLITPRSIVLSMSLPEQKFSAESFLSPPSSSGAYTWWHWMNGNITKTGITKDLEAMKAVGIAGFQMFEAGSGIPLGDIESLSDEWIEMIAHAVKESQRLGLEFAMHNCPGWSSSGGPWITPDRSMQEITFSEVKISGGRKVSVQLEQPTAKLNYYKDSLLIAFPSASEAFALTQDWKMKANYRAQSHAGASSLDQTNLALIPPADVIDISRFMDQKGLLRWDAPEGDWIVMRFGHTATGQQNHSAPTLGTGLDCDKLSAPAMDFHFNKMFGRIMPLLNSAAKTGKVGLLIDSYEMGFQNWTAELPQEFLKRRGYSITSFMPALAGKVVGNETLTEKFLWDFRRTLADLMAEAYYGHFQKLCKANNIITYTEPYGTGPFEEMQVGKRLDINMGEFWSGITNLWPNAELSRTVKLAASISRIKGEPIVGAESFTAEPGSGKWQQYPYSMKALGDLMFTKGVTRYYFHRYAHQPHPTAVPGMTMGPWGIHFERTNTWWSSAREWLSYISRSQFVLRQGKFFADLLYFTGEEVPVATLNPEKSSMPPPPGYDYDLIDKEALVSVSIDDGQSFSLPGGFGYRLLVLPRAKFMSIAVLEQLKRLIRQGLIVVGPRPTSAPGMLNEKMQAVFSSLVSELWGNLDGTNTKATQTGKGKLYWTEDLKSVLSLENFFPDLTVLSQSGDAPINYIHRITPEADIYFLANNRRSPETTIVSFRIAGAQPELWDPVNGSTTPILVFEEKNGITSIPLTFEESGSFFILFRKSKSITKISVSLNNSGLLPLQDFVSAKNANKAIFSTFSISGWFKPEVDIALDPDQFFGEFLTDNYAVYPASGELFYGPGHAGTGFTAGRNGLVLFEHSTKGISAVTYVKIPVEGWTHFAVNYIDNTPSVFINGVLKASGARSQFILHPSIGDAHQRTGASYYNGDLAQLEVHPDGLTDKEISVQAGLGLKPSIPALSTAAVKVYNGGLLFWKTGNYHINLSDVKHESVSVQRIDAPISLENNWLISFPEDLGAPPSIKLDVLQSLHKHPFAGIKYFSGTATYVNTFNLVNPDVQGKRFFLDLGRVEVIAEVSINGKPVGLLWKPPFYADITSAIVAGVNTVQVKVTNLWPNRLIGDEHLAEENDYDTSSNPGKFTVLYAGGIKKLPAWYTAGQPKPKGGRITFTTWKHYSKQSPLLESGLLGPVQILSADYKKINVSTEEYS
jgi:hypothetical protein